ncbi:unnamed protein product [Clavelina lepadiformis]|uniref:DNA-directed RNA polymerase n=1 Tax=Clavelina lepadiformis TaxID=159417 RepID=A0ABP0GHT9_CLALP
MSFNNLYTSFLQKSQSADAFLRRCSCLWLKGRPVSGAFPRRRSHQFKSTDLKHPSWCVQLYYRRLLASPIQRAYYVSSTQSLEEDELEEDLEDSWKDMEEEEELCLPLEDFGEPAATEETSFDDKPMKKQDYSAQDLRKRSSFFLNYIQACVNTGHLNEAVKAVVKRQLCENDLKAIDFLLTTLVNLSTAVCQQQSIDVIAISQQIFAKVLKMQLIPTPNTCACILAIFKRYENDSLFESFLGKVKEMYTVEEVLKSCHRRGVTFKYLLELFNQVELNFEFQETQPKRNTPPSIVKDLYKTKFSSRSLNLPDELSFGQLLSSLDEQLQREVKGTMKVPNVMSGQPISLKQQAQRRKLKKLHEEWKVTALGAFRVIKQREHKRWFDRRSHDLGLYPFLCLIPDEAYADIIVNQLHHIPHSGKITQEIVLDIGDTVFKHYALKNDFPPESRERLKTIYKEYLHLFKQNKPTELLREVWEKLESEHGKIQVENKIAPWQNLWKIIVGRRLLEVMVSTLTIGIGSCNTAVPTAYFSNIPAVFNSYKTWGKKMHGMTIPHPVYAKLVKEADEMKGSFVFPTEHLPMLVPPLPWIHPDQGGFVCCPTDFIRQQKYMDMHDDQPQEYKNSLCATADALNVLSSVAWKINKKVLDVQLKIFRSRGDTTLKVAPPPPEIPYNLNPKLVKNSPNDERKQLRCQYFKAKKTKYEMNSLHADALYKFSIANYYRNKMFWLPHNLDFRGRTYPVPPHFNYMGDDVSRSIFLFAKGRPLGERGVRWLKVHLVNLTGKKKYDNLESRLQYANEMLDEIFDSADNPLEGRCWWKDSDDPWQTLAACIELTAALRSPNPEKFVSHLPIYQDGSCNGLQHYAALGRDVVGAKQVNLQAVESPQDVYTGVAEIVDEIRKKDAENGVEIAKDLEGFISRKVVKQTVMTTVYGVTRYGGALQIRRQLMNISDFPANKCMPASIYIVNAIFQSISAIFTSATSIQKWLTNLAYCLSKGGHSVEWKTTLGLCAVQPYFKTVAQRVESPLQTLNLMRPTTAPLVMKQCNAFPPNFVHSLDSTHMMLTALHCYHAGVTFSAVHDCYWTHACTVDQMSVLCREQFIELHQQPILEQLAGFLYKFLPREGSDSDEAGEFIAESQRDRFRELLSNIPTKGEFDLNEVKKSVFFFS